MKYIKLFEEFIREDLYGSLGISLASHSLIDEIRGGNMNPDRIREMISSGINIDALDDSPLHSSALHWSVRLNQLFIVNMLIDSGADVDIQDSLGRTPLHLSVESGSVSICSDLIRAGSLVDLRTIYGNTALGWSVIYNRAEIMRILLDSGADVDISGHRGYTALHWSAEYNRIGIAEELLSFGANPSISDKRGRLPYELTEVEELKELLKP